TAAAPLVPESAAPRAPWEMPMTATSDPTTTPPESERPVVVCPRCRGELRAAAEAVDCPRCGGTVVPVPAGIPPTEQATLPPSRPDPDAVTLPPPPASAEAVTQPPVHVDSYPGEAREHAPGDTVANQPGTVFPRVPGYEIVGELGRGGMG